MPRRSLPAATAATAVATTDAPAPPAAGFKPSGSAREKPQSIAAQQLSAPPAAIDIDNYQDAKAWLMSHVDHERLRVVDYSDGTFALDRMHALLAVLGDPHLDVQTVHVAGTKGKGSTCAMLASMLRACGYTTGLYTSPHLIDLRERVTINDHMIPYAEAAEQIRKVAAAEQELGFGLTFFEVMTAVAFLHFAENAVDVAVLETGLGGRLDCTNVCQPLVTGITSIGLDHTALLGETLPEIAREKAGIFKDGVPALSVEQHKEVVKTLKECAEEANTTVQFVGKDVDFSYRFESSRELGPHTRVCLTTKQNRFDHLAVPLPGEHQAHNCGLALAMLDRLKEHGFSMKEEQVFKGLQNTKLHGRMEKMWDTPRVYIDGAHNGSSVEALIKSLGAHVKYDSLVMIFGCNDDKDVPAMLREVGLGADKVLFTKSKGNVRAAEPSSLERRFEEVSGKMSQVCDSLEDALKVAHRAVGREDLIVICGSFYLAGEARKYFLEAKKRVAKQQRG